MAKWGLEDLMQDWQLLHNGVHYDVVEAHATAANFFLKVYFEHFM